jgi:hypothetical protein
MLSAKFFMSLSSRVRCMPVRTCDDD